MTLSQPKIIVVGGGAGGLELATRLGRVSRKNAHKLPWLTATQAIYGNHYYMKWRQVR